MPDKRIDETKRLIGMLYQRANAEGRESDIVDLRSMMVAIESVEDKLNLFKQGIAVKGERLEALEQEYAKLYHALIDRDEENLLIAELADTIRDEFIRQMDSEGYMTPNDMTDAAAAKGMPRDRAVDLVQWITGDGDKPEWFDQWYEETFGR